MSRITRQDWLDGAVKALADGGFAALAVEPLARQLKISKGSFYHHFDSLDDLVQQLLVYWEAEATEAVSDTLDQVKDPHERLALLFQASWDRIDHLKAEAALMAAAVAGDPRVRPVYLRVQRRRLDYTRSIYKALGARDPDRSARVAYGSYLGTLQLVVLDSPFKNRSELRAHAAAVYKLLKS